MNTLNFLQPSRQFTTLRTLLSKSTLRNGKNRGTSSNEWLSRQLSDPYVEKAKMMNYRCRSAFKLIEINNKFQILCPGQVVVDIGAAPGSWTQIAVEEVNAKHTNTRKPKGRVYSIDRQQIFPIEGATVLSNLDFETETAHEKLKGLLDGAEVDVVLSDMAPSATGVRELDQDKIIGLCYRAFRFAAQVSKKDSTLLVKVWDGVEVPVLELDLLRFYKTVKSVKPLASRSDSAEKFILARGFKGLEK